MLSAAQSRTAEPTEQLKPKAPRDQPGQTQEVPSLQSDEGLPLLQPQGETAQLAQSQQPEDNSKDSSCFSWSRPWQLELTQIVRLSAPATIQVRNFT